MMNPEPTGEHQWLQQLLGDWTFEACTGEGSAGEKHEGKETGRAIGSLWVQLEGHAPMPDGGESTTLMTLGYDPAKGRFVGSWIGSMMANQWVYEGSLDATGRILTLDTEGPSFAEPGKTGRYRDVIEIKGPDHRVLTGHTLGEDGEWTEFMETSYHRAR